MCCLCKLQLYYFVYALLSVCIVCVTCIAFHCVFNLLLCVLSIALFSFSVGRFFTHWHIGGESHGYHKPVSPLN
jgi:hypothetical protein